MTGISTELRIPDLWYDFYARLVPGTAFVAAVYVFRLGAAAWPSTLQTVILGLAGYFTAIITQPISSRVTGWIHDLAAKVAGVERLFVRRSARALDLGQQQILSKMHGEATLFVQLSVFSVILIAHQALLDNDGPRWFWFALAAVAFVLEALEVAHRRIKRAQDLTLASQGCEGGGDAS
jgi:hypothetical protein